VHAIAPFEELYRRNGLQFLPFNTLYQLAAEQASPSGCLDIADSLLLVPDLIGFELTGERVAERTNASTTGLLRVDTREWDDELIERLGIPAAVFPRLVDPGEVVGALRPEVAAELGAGARHPLEVVAVGSHDTASAVVAVPMRPESAAVHLVRHVGPRGRRARASGHVGCRARRELHERGRRRRSRAVPAQRDGPLAAQRVGAAVGTRRRGGRPGRAARGRGIRDRARRRVRRERRSIPGARRHAGAHRRVVPGARCPVPASQAEFARSIIESLAQAFAEAVADAARLSNTAVDTIHIVGGGALNELLCRRTADRSGLPVLAGPVEATAIGNVLVQARAQGFAGRDLESLRASCRPRSRPAGTSRAGDAIGLRSGVREQLQADDDRAEHHEREQREQLRPPREGGAAHAAKPMSPSVARYTIVDTRSAVSSSSHPGQVSSSSTIGTDADPNAPLAMRNIRPSSARLGKAPCAARWAMISATKPATVMPEHADHERERGILRRRLVAAQHQHDRESGEGRVHPLLQRLGEHVDALTGLPRSTPLPRPARAFGSALGGGGSRSCSVVHAQHGSSRVGSGSPATGARGTRSGRIDA
jgi:rhamnulokinase